MLGHRTGSRLRTYAKRDVNPINGGDLDCICETICNDTTFGVESGIQIE